MDSLIIFCAKYLFLAAVLILGLLWLKASRLKKIEIAIAAIAAGIIAYGLMKFAGGLYYDTRPFVTQHIKPLVSHGADNGFPSEHTVFTMTMSSVIYCYNKRLGIIAFTVTLIVGISRILAHVHSPIDIAGGLVIGAAAGAAGYWVAKEICKKLSSKD